MLKILKHVNLIDGTGKDLVEKAIVVMRDDQIVYAGKSSEWNSTVGEESITLDLHGRFVLPGLIDSHVHLCSNGEVDSRVITNDAETTLSILKNAQLSLAAGITTVRDLGGWNELEFAAKKWINAGKFPGSRLMLAGRFISITESGAEYYHGMYRVADGVNEVRKAVREQVKNGADLIKIGVTGAVLVEDGEPGITHFNYEEIHAAVEEAGKFNRRVAAHAHGVDGIGKAMQAGVHTIEHGTFLHHDPNVIDEMAKRGTFLVPTLLAGWAVIEGDFTGVPEWIQKKNRDTQDDAVKSLRMAYEAGVPIAMGSDASTPKNYHGMNALEIYWMQQAGMSAMDAIVAATKNAAKALGWDSWLGTLEAGKTADLIVVNQNPLDDLKSLYDKKNLQLVIKNGEAAALNPEFDLPPSLKTQDILRITK